MKTEVEKSWNLKRDKLKQKYIGITDNDLFFRLGSEKRMIEVLSYKLGKTEKELLQIIIAL
jgi:hypothetical protein